jgi:hypothetical protein
MNGHNIMPSHTATRELKRYAALIGLELEHYIVSIEFGKLHGHLDYDMVNHVITQNGKLLKLCSRYCRNKSSVWENFGKSFQTEN